MGMGKIVIAGLENIATELGCSKKTLYKWIRQRQFPAFKMDGVWRAMPKDIVVWFDGMRQSADQTDPLAHAFQRN